MSRYACAPLRWSAQTRVILTVLLLLAGSRPIVAQDDHAGHGPGDGTFGTVHFEISCSPASQQAFDRALAMLHSFFYPETEKAFRVVADREPSCAMAYWGIAISQRPNPLTAPFPPELLKKGLEAIEQARAASQATPRERDWIEALAPFFLSSDTVAQSTRSMRYEAAMARLHERYPADSEAAVFYALSLLEAVDLTDKTYAKQLKAAGILEGLHAAHPDHPGIVHYIIHSYDYAPIAEKGLPAARGYASLASSAPHALHMPSHIFSVLGMWPEAIRANLAADAANRAYAERTNPGAATNLAAVAARYHPLDFLTNAYLQLGQDRAAKAILDERNSISTLPASASITAHTAFAAIAVRYAIERGAWADAAALPPLSTNYKPAEAIIWLGRALGAARSGNPSRGNQDLTQLSRLRQELASAGDPYWAEQVGIEETAAAAWIALGSGKSTQAIALMRQAADREDHTEKHVAMENRLSPMRELLGELLLQAHKPGAALREFERSLQVVPRRFRSLAGAAQAAVRSGNRRLAVSYYQQLLRLAETADGDRPQLAAARTFLRASAR